MRAHPLLTIFLAVVGMVFAVVGPGDGHTGAQPSAGAEVGGARYRLDPAGADRDGAQFLDHASRAGGFRFRADTAPVQRRAFMEAVARAQPEARRLIELVDGVTDVRLEPTDGDAVGVTVAGGERYDVAIDIRRAEAMYGPRGIDRVVMHELGHVIDSALLTEAMMAPLQAAIPAGTSCEAACDVEAERFAETFARWATGDAGADMSVGYDVALPGPSLEAWGAPLALLAGSAPARSSPGL
jgi:hypothetical protein